MSPEEFVQENEFIIVMNGKKEIQNLHIKLIIEIQNKCMMI